MNKYSLNNKRIKVYVRVLNNNPSILAVFLIIAIALSQVLQEKRWNHPEMIIQSDVTMYYAYLPAAFIYKDITLNFVSEYEGPYKFKIAYDITPTGKRMPRYTIGQSVLYSPFFFLGHLTAKMTKYDASGYTEPYKFFLAISSLFYVFIGLLALRKILLKFFPQWVVAATLILVALGTNLYHYYTCESPMTHAYSFALISCFILYTDKWHVRPTVKNSLIIGIVVALFTLVRPFNILVVLVFLLYNVTSFNSLGKKVRFFLHNLPKILLILFTIFALYIPQFIYWKYCTGHFLYYAYGGPGGNFYFNNPHIIDGLFSYRKGWFLYNPIMVFAMVGIFWLRRYHKNFFVAFLVFFIVFIYVLFHGGAGGMVED